MQINVSCFFESFTSIYGIWSWTIWSRIINNVEEFSKSRVIFVKHTAYGHAPGVVCISDMVLGSIGLRNFFQIINGPRPYGSGAYGPSWAINRGQNLQNSMFLIKVLGSVSFSVPKVTKTPDLVITCEETATLTCT